MIEIQKSMKTFPSLVLLLFSLTVRGAEVGGGGVTKAQVTNIVEGAISNTAYDSTTWNGVTSIAPSKDAIRDKIVAMDAAITGLGGITATIAIPKTFYALEGREFNIYFANVIRSSVPIGDVDVDITCSVGAQFRDWYRFTPVAANAGNYALTLTVLQNGTTLATATNLLVVKALTNGPVTRKLLVIGDSTTENSGSLAELTNLLTGDVFHVNFVGAVAYAGLDASGNTRNLHDEAVAGRSVAYYYANVASPFVTGGNFNFNYYLTNNSITMASGDWVTIQLGINDTFSADSDAAITTVMNTLTNQLNGMITSIKAAVSGIRIGLCLMTPPAANQDAFGNNYTAGQYQARFLRNQKLWVERMISMWDGTQANVFLVPIHANLDTVNNVATTSVVVNARNPATYQQQNNGVHPNTYGYFQITDSLFAFLKGNE